MRQLIINLLLTGAILSLAIVGMRLVRQGNAQLEQASTQTIQDQSHLVSR